jgi:hypothetical protein
VCVSGLLGEATQLKHQHITPHSTAEATYSAIVLNVNGVIKGIYASEIVHYIYGITGLSPRTAANNMPQVSYTPAMQCPHVNGVIRGIYASEIVHYIYGIIGHATLRHHA